MIKYCNILSMHIELLFYLLLYILLTHEYVHRKIRNYIVIYNLYILDEELFNIIIYIINIYLHL